ncbi:hypothetical protein LJC56_12090 [Christensenellaceae bacterium OttesenSCG-928-K19]|nr:hypothetical protein [Christensenellaceae bacterium OttesenSCG-928-K19]
MKKKMLFGFVIAVVVTILIIWLEMKYPNLNMDFDAMRNPINEENFNNMNSSADMAADENYVCFFHENYGLVCYDIKKDRYTTLHSRVGQNGLFSFPHFSVKYGKLQMKNGTLYYIREDVQNCEGNALWKVDLSTKEKECIWGDNITVFDNYLVLEDGYLIQSDYSRLYKIDENGTQLINEIWGQFMVLNDCVYFIDSSGKYPEEKEFVCKQSILKPSIKKNLGLESSQNTYWHYFKIHDSSVYVISAQTKNGNEFESISEHSVYVIEDDELSYVGEYSARHSGVTFFDDYIICEEGVFTLDWEKVADLSYLPRFNPVVVGGNLYVKSDDPLDLPRVGEDWYKLDVDQLIEEYINR